MILLYIFYVIPEILSEVVLNLKAHDLRQGDASSFLQQKEAGRSPKRRVETKFFEPNICIKYDNHDGLFLNRAAKGKTPACSRPAHYI